MPPDKRERVARLAALPGFLIVFRARSHTRNCMKRRKGQRVVSTVRRRVRPSSLYISLVDTYIWMGCVCVRAFAIMFA